MFVLPGTSEIHAQTFAQALGVSVLKSPEPQDWAFLVGVSPQCNEVVKECRKVGTKVAGYWIGSDSLSAIMDSEYRRKIPALDFHFAVHERVADELLSWGVKAETLYPCSRGLPEGQKLPMTRGKKVGVYSPTPDLGDHDLYMFQACARVAKENPEIDFLFYGSPDGYPQTTPNMKDFGRRSPEETSSIYEEVSCILRLCHHDGFPVGGIEAKQNNLHVIENFPYPGFLHVTSLQKVNEYLRDERVYAGDFSGWPMWYRQHCSPHAFEEKVNECLNLALAA